MKKIVLALAAQNGQIFHTFSFLSQKVLGPILIKLEINKQPIEADCSGGTVLVISHVARRLTPLVTRLECRLLMSGAEARRLRDDTE